MKIMVNLSENFIDVWNEEKEMWERYAKVSLAPDEENKIPEKIKLYTLSDNNSADFTTLQDFNNRDIQRTINWILDYLKSKGE